MRSRSCDQHRRRFAHHVLRRSWSGDRRWRSGSGTRIAPTPGGQFGNGHGAGAAHREIRPGVGLGHVVDEGQHVGLDAAPARSCARRVDPALAGLMANLRTRASRQDAASACGTTAFRRCAPWLPPKTSRRMRPVAAGEAHRRRRQRRDVGAHRIADGARVDVRAEAARKCLQHLASRGAPASDWSSPRSRSARGSAAECAAATRRCRRAR